MKKTVCSLLFCLLSTTQAFAQCDSSAAQPPGTIDVSADALVQVVPDRVVFNIGMNTRSPRLLDAQQKNKEAIQKAAAIAEKFGIPKKNISTNYMKVEPSFDKIKSSTRHVVEYYDVQQQMVILLQDVGKYESFLNALLEAGINEINDVTFQSGDMKNLRNKARALAIDAAKEKAAFLTKSAGLKLGKPLGLFDNTSNCGWATSRGNRMSPYMNAVSNVESRPEAPISEADDPVGLGTISVRASVTLRFAVE